MLAWREATQLVAVGVGAAYGAAIMFLAYGLIWVFLGGPVQELIEEKLLDPWRRRAYKSRDSLIAVCAFYQVQESAPSPASGSQGGPYRILVSDLHIDTWDEERKRAFLSFLQCVYETPAVTELYLNGDLMDLPLHPAHAGKDEPLTLNIELDSTATVDPLLPAENSIHRTEETEMEEEQNDTMWQGVLPQKLDETLQSLMSLAQRPRKPRLRFYYLTGNHDIGISGLRYFRPDLLGIPAQASWNPSLLILGQSVTATVSPDAPENARNAQPSEMRRTAVYIEHGHLHDPFLWLYLHYAFLDLLRGGQQRQDQHFFTGMQRGAKRGMAKADSASKADSAPRAVSAAGAKHSAAEHESLSLPEKLVVYRYRHAARRARNQLRIQWPELEITTVILGHTHLPDMLLVPGKRGDQQGECKLINAGSWSGEKNDQLYWVIGPDGQVSDGKQWAVGGTLDLCVV